MDKNSLAHTKWNCKYHIVFTPKYRRQVIYKQISTDIKQGSILKSIASFLCLLIVAFLYDAKHILLKQALFLLAHHAVTAIALLA